MKENTTEILLKINQLLKIKKQESSYLSLNDVDLLSKTPASISLKAKTLQGQDVFVKFYFSYFDDKIIGLKKYERHVIALKYLNNICPTCAPKLIFHHDFVEERNSFIITEFVVPEKRMFSLKEILLYLSKIRERNETKIKEKLVLNSPTTLIVYVKTYFEFGNSYLDTSLVTEPTLRIIERRIKYLDNIFQSLPNYLKKLKNYTVNISHGDLHKDNILPLPNGELMFIDWDFACISPLEYEIAMLKENVFQELTLEEINKKTKQIFNVNLDYGLIHFYRLAINLINALWAFNVLIRLSSSESSKDNLFSNPSFLEQYTMDSLKKFDFILFSE